MTIFKSVGNSTVFSAIGTISSYTLTVLLARDGGAAPFGEYLLCLAWAAIMTVFIDCAADSAFSHLSINSDNVQVAFNTAMTIRATALLGLFVLFGLAKVFELVDIPWLMFIFLLPSFNLGLLFEFYRTNIKYSVIICLEKTILLLMNLVLLSYIKFDVAIYISYATVSIMSLIFQAHLHSHHISALRLASAQAIRSYVNSYWPLLLIALAQISYGHLSRIVIEGKQGIVVFASVSLAFQVVALASIVQTQVDRNFRPIIIETVKVGDPRRLRQLILHYLLASTLPMTLGSIVTFLIAPWLINLLFGSKYQLAGEVLREISPLFISISLMRLADLIMLALNQTRQNLIINLSGSMLMLFLMQNIQASQPLTLFMAIIVATQFLQVTLSGLLAFRMLRRRFV